MIEIEQTNCLETFINNLNLIIMFQQILLSLTFVFGVLSMLTYTLLFKKNISGFFDSIFLSKTPEFFKWLDIIILLFSLCYQSWYWLFQSK